MKIHRFLRFSRIPPPLLLTVLLTLEPHARLDCAPQTISDFGPLAVAGGRRILLPRNATAVIVADLRDDANPERIAALEQGGLLVQSLDGVSLSVLVPQQHARALTALDLDGNGTSELVVALNGGGLLALNRASREATLLSTIHAVSLASGDVNADGRLELIAARPGGGVVLLDVASREVAALSTVEVSHVATGNFLGRAYDQIVMTFASGGLAIHDLSKGDVLVHGSLTLRSLTAGDLDGDGIDEIVALDARGALLVISLPEEPMRIDWLDPSSLPATFTDPFLVIQIPVDDGEVFLRGDTNGDGSIDISDCVALLDCLFLGASCSECPDAADSNDSGRLDISDVVYCLHFLFSGGDDVPGIGDQRCRADPTPDALPECRYPRESCRRAGGPPALPVEDADAPSRMRLNQGGFA